MIYVFYNNDPLAQDQGGGAEHFRGLHRALLTSGLRFHLVAARLQDERDASHITYVSRSSHFLLFFIGTWLWFLRNRGRLGKDDVFHFHRNYAAWPKLLLAPRTGRVVISYHNVSGRVIEGKLGRLSAPIRQAMLFLERHVVRLADAIICVSNRDRGTLGKVVAKAPFQSATVIPAAFDQTLFEQSETRPPTPTLARKLLFMGRISHQKNVPLAIATLEHLVAEGHVAELTIAGDGEGSRDLMRRIACSPAASRIKWIGRVPHDDVPALLAEHGILLLSSRYEASPTVVKEALQALRPIVSTDVGDVSDWIEDGRNGFVCESHASALASGVIRAQQLILTGRYEPTSQLDRLDEGEIMGAVVDLYRRLQSVQTA